MHKCNIFVIPDGGYEIDSSWQNYDGRILNGRKQSQSGLEICLIQYSKFLPDLNCAHLIQVMWGLWSLLLWLFTPLASLQATWLRTTAFQPSACVN